MGYKGRDVEMVMLNESQCIVTACDSCGAIGSKEFDVVKSTPYIVGRFTARVSLMEVLAVGAIPKTISVAISNELYPTGEGVIKGVDDELRYMGISFIPMVISTEKNVTTRQTAVGITVIGACEKDNLRIATSKPEDVVYCLGVPNVGNEINHINDKDIIQGGHVKELLNIKGVHDILPIGSKGILKETEALAQSINCKFILELQNNIDVNKSAGPSTCLIFTCTSDTNSPQFDSTPIAKIGRFVLNDFLVDTPLGNTKFL